MLKMGSQIIEESTIKREVSSLYPLAACDVNIDTANKSFLNVSLLEYSAKGPNGSINSL